jgi:hypothetical protein
VLSCLNLTFVSGEAQINWYFKKSLVVEPVETRGLLGISQHLKYLKTYASVLISGSLKNQGNFFALHEVVYMF